MHDSTAPKPAKLPFFLADLVLLGAAWFVYSQSAKPLTAPTLGILVACVALGATFGILPFMLEFRALVKWAESDSLQSVVGQIQQLEMAAAQISGATAQWQGVQEAATSTAATARGIAEAMAAEVKGFASFMEKARESEKATLQLEVQKLRRAETDWLQVLIHVLDHTYALYKAAERSSQRSVADQISAFQNACRDAARRVGLTPFVPAVSEAFDSSRHQLLDANGKVPEGASVADTIATGFTYQGRIIRPALVQLQTGTAIDKENSESLPTPSAEGQQPALPLEPNSGAGDPA